MIAKSPIPVLVPHMPPVGAKAKLGAKAIGWRGWWWVTSCHTHPPFADSQATNPSVTYDLTACVIGITFHRKVTPGPIAAVCNRLR
jgi:hypothetical protein